MERIFEYQLKKEDLEDTNGGRVIWILRRRIGLTAHEFRHAKYTPQGICVRHPDGSGRKVMLNELLFPGDTLVVRLTDSDLSVNELDVVASKGELEILYEDEDAIVINKPAGVVVHPSHGHYADSIANYLAWYFGGKRQQVIPRAVGRLDKETSGALLFAKNRAAAARLFAQRKNGKMGRRYIALAQGVFPERKGTVEKPICPAPGSDTKRCVCRPGEGQEAYTEYTVLREINVEDKTFSLLSVEIRTGRTHQIRVHMQSEGHPLAGDTLYGTGTSWFQRTMLHAAELWFEQPFSGKPVRLTAPFPEDFRNL